AMRTVILCAMSFVFLCPCQGQDKDDVKPLAEIIRLVNTAASDSDRAIILLDEAIAYQLRAGGEKSDLDSAKTILLTVDQLNSRLRNKHVEAKSLLVSAFVHHDAGDTAAAHATVLKAISIYKTLPYPNETGEAYLHLSTYYPTEVLSQVADKRAIFAEALPYFRQAANKKRQADVLKDLGDLDQLLKKFGLALNELKESLSLYNSVHYNKTYGVYDLLGILSTSLGDYPDAVEYGSMAAKMAEEQHDTSLQLCTIYSRLATAYANWDKHAESAIYQRKALDIAIHFKGHDEVLVTMINLCFELVKQNQIQPALSLVRSTQKYLQLRDYGDSLYLFTCYNLVYTRLNELNRAREYANKIEAILPHADEGDPRLYAVYSVLVPYYIAVHQYDAATDIAKRFRMGTIANGSKTHIVAAYLASFKVDSAMGRFKEALGYYQSYKLLSDSIFRETKAFQVAQMQVAMETEKKDNELKLKQQDIQLLRSENEIEQVGFRRKSMFRNVAIVSTLIAAVILFVLFKLKQRRNAILQAQQDKINLQNKILEEAIAEKNQLLSEKEWLVKEIHHRVKNNLQIIISLLNSQSNYLDSKEAIAAITESRHRMQAMSLIHQKLYQSDDTKSVSMRSYIHELADYLKASFAYLNKIGFSLHIDDVELDITQAIPVGLILNEAITNSIKYAFDTIESGCISVRMENSDGDIILEVADNGKGFPAGFDARESDTLGMLLITGLVKQIGGKLDLYNRNGAVVVISFKMDKRLDLSSQKIYKLG
ncbi:MAG TPA: histidine kinase dimerization/phosphoacceptor domain -containing protein, partial [Puia sp.]|nr:histidine kinase dimerization/phosphoacceptor domain -containing protein [Puia sp.]